MTVILGLICGETGRVILGEIRKVIFGFTGVLVGFKGGSVGFMAVKLAFTGPCKVLIPEVSRSSSQ